VPTPPPVTTPPPVMVATVMVPLVHTPPLVPSDNVIENVWQIGALSVIATGCVFTVTVFVTKQLPITYDIVAVPTELPVTVPSVPTVATPVFELLHTPPPVASVSAVVDPWHTLAVPVIAAGCVFTVTTAVEVHAPPL